MVFVTCPGDVPLAAGFVPPIAAPALLRLPRGCHHPSSSSYEVEQLSSRLTGRCRHGSIAAPSAAVAAHTRLFTAPNNCNYRVRRTIPTCTAAASSSSGDDNLPGTGGEGTAAAGSTSAAASSSPSAVITAAEEGNEQKGGGEAVGSTSNPEAGLIDPFVVAPGAGAARAAPGGWGAAAGSFASDFEWEGAEGAAWTEFEDWLVQDTYSRCAELHFVIRTRRAIFTAAQQSQPPSRCSDLKKQQWPKTGTAVYPLIFRR